MTIYYPLVAGNTWTYKMKDGNTFTNSVLAADGNVFTMKNSMQDQPQIVRKGGGVYWTDSFERGNFQVLLKDDLKKGDTWEIKYKANGIESILTMTVKETGGSKAVDGKIYSEVLLIEGDMRMNINGNLMSANYLVQYYYSPGVGLVLTTSSYGDSMGLASCTLK